jgi:hypothetical protein
MPGGDYWPGASVCARRPRSFRHERHERELVAALPTIDLIVAINTEFGAGYGEELWVNAIGLMHT